MVFTTIYYYLTIVFAEKFLHFILDGGLLNAIKLLG